MSGVLSVSVFIALNVKHINNSQGDANLQVSLDFEFVSYLNLSLQRDCDETVLMLVTN